MNICSKLYLETTYRVDPEPRADAVVARARGQLSRHLELRVQIPHAGLVHTEDSEVVRLDVIPAGLVRDCERTSLDVILAVGVELRRRLTWTGPVATISCVPSDTFVGMTCRDSRLRETHPWEEAYHEVAPLSQDSSALMEPPAGSSTKAPSFGG